MGLFIVVGLFSATGQMGESAFTALMVTREGVLRGEVWRLVTYAFLTSGMMELFFKVLVFYYIAAPLEAAWGTIRFLSLLGVSVLGGGATAALLGVPLAGGWAPMVTLMLIHGFLFPESKLLLLFFLPIRVKTLALISIGFFLLTSLGTAIRGLTSGSVPEALKALALFAGMFSGVIYYVITTRSIPWVRKTRRRAAAGALDPAGIVKKLSIDRLMERSRRIVQEHDQGRPLTDENRAFIEELIQRSDPAKELCSPYSFSPTNEICPPCAEFGRCLRRHLEAEDDEPSGK